MHGGVSYCSESRNRGEFKLPKKVWHDCVRALGILDECFYAWQNVQFHNEWTRTELGN